MKHLLYIFAFLVSFIGTSQTFSFECADGAEKTQFVVPFSRQAVLDYMDFSLNGENWFTDNTFGFALYVADGREDLTFQNSTGNLDVVRYDGKMADITSKNNTETANILLELIYGIPNPDAPAATTTPSTDDEWEAAYPTIDWDDPYSFIAPFSNEIGTDFTSWTGTITFGMHDTHAGYTVSGLATGTYEIGLDEFSWNRFSHNGKIWLMYHEFGHAFLDLPHVCEFGDIMFSNTECDARNIDITDVYPRPNTVELFRAAVSRMTQ